MTRVSVVLVAPFDDAHHAHGSQRLRALERLGCEVTGINLLDEDRRRLMFRRRGWLRDLESVLAQRPGPDVVLVIGVPDRGAEALDDLRGGNGAAWVNWFPADLGTSERLARHAEGYRQLFAAGSDVARELAARLGRTVDLLPLACDPSVYRPNPERGQQYRANVVFAGRATWRRELLLSQLVEFGLALWGPGWRETALRDYCRGETMDTEEFVRAYAGASVAVNIHHTREPNGGSEASCNQRLFEIAAIGVPQVVDYREDLPRWFAPGDEVEVFHSADEMKRQVETILHHPPLGEALGGAARRRVLSEHTYMHRLRMLLDRVGARPTPRSASSE